MFGYQTLGPFKGHDFVPFANRIVRQFELLRRGGVATLRLSKAEDAKCYRNGSKIEECLTGASADAIESDIYFYSTQIIQK
jgi:hypothetical protein